MIDHIKSSLISIWNNRARGVLTLLGVIIGVASISTLIAISQGLKNDVSGLVEGLGSNIIAVIGGKINTKDPTARDVSSAVVLDQNVLSVEDVTQISSVSGVKVVAPMSQVGSAISYQAASDTVPVVGSTPQFLEAVDVFKIESGKMFSADNRQHEVVITRDVVDSLFGKNDDSLGKTVRIMDQDFVVIGIFAKPKATSVLGSDFNTIALIPYGSAVDLANGRQTISRIVVRVNDGNKVANVKSAIRSRLLEVHHIENFTVLTQEDLLNFFNQFLNMASALIVSTASISLVVGGIGIMNIMLVTVTERNREIGLRKAVGATRTSIMMQFIIEAIIITTTGGFLGLAAAFMVVDIVARYSELSPVITPQVMALAVSVSVATGIVFGLWPAYLAANKDPIQAIRDE